MKMRRESTVSGIPGTIPPKEDGALASSEGPKLRWNSVLAIGAAILLGAGASQVYNRSAEQTPIRVPAGTQPLKSSGVDRYFAVDPEKTGLVDCGQVTHVLGINDDLSEYKQIAGNVGESILVICGGAGSDTPVIEINQ